MERPGHKKSEKWRGFLLKKFVKMAPFMPHTVQRLPMLSQAVQTSTTSDVSPTKQYTFVSTSTTIPGLAEKLGSASSNSSEVEFGAEPVDGVVLTINWPSQVPRNRQIIPLKKKPLKRIRPPKVFKPFGSFMDTEMTVRSLREIVDRQTNPSVFEVPCLNLIHHPNK